MSSNNVTEKDKDSFDGRDRSGGNSSRYSPFYWDSMSQDALADGNKDLAIERLQAASAAWREAWMVCSQRGGTTSIPTGGHSINLVENTLFGNMQSQLDAYVRMREAARIDSSKWPQVLMLVQRMCLAWELAEVLALQGLDEPTKR